MKNTFLLMIFFIFLFSCGTLTDEASRVELIKIENTELEISNAKKNLESKGCKSLGQIEALVGPGSSDERLVTNLKNKAALQGANKVISTLMKFDFSIRTFGFAYHCP